MKENLEIVNPELEDETDIVAQLAQSSLEDPITPQSSKKFKVNKKSSAYAFYEEIRLDLKEWWDEFNSTLDDTGNLKYRTIIRFARDKGKTRLERELIMEMIGPMPEVRPNRQLRVPWLGDWQTRRDNGFWAPTQSGQIRELARSFKEKIVNWDAVRQATPYLVQEMARYEKKQEDIDRAFAGQTFNKDKSPTSDENQQRFNVQLAMMIKVTKWKIKLLHEYMKVFGIDPDNPVQIQMVNAMSQSIQSPAGMMEGGLPQMTDGTTQESLQMVKVARMLTLHANRYNLPLPKELLPQEPPKQEIETPKKGNGKLQ